MAASLQEVKEKADKGVKKAKPGRQTGNKSVPKLNEHGMLEKPSGQGNRSILAMDRQVIR